MPMQEAELSDVRSHVFSMFMDTMKTFDEIRNNADAMFGESAPQIKAAIDECLDDFLHKANRDDRPHPEALIYSTDRASFQKAGFYGAQLKLKESQVSRANKNLRQSLSGQPINGIFSGFWKKPFRKWVDIINNFLGSLGPATGIGEIFKELKDCLRDELPDDD